MSLDKLLNSNILAWSVENSKFVRILEAENRTKQYPKAFLAFF
jgi:hypothetical protein